VHEEDALNETGYLVTYEILESEVEDLPIELFLFRRQASQQINKPAGFNDNFITVCTLSDVFTYPANEMDCEHPFFRKSVLKGVVPTMEEANRVLLRIEDLLTSLLRSVKLINQSAVEVERYISI
jgi:hypothetical protein